MTSIPIDTYRLINTLKQRGFTEEQAKGVTEAIQEIDLQEVVSKDYLKRELRELELRMTIKLGSIVFAGTGLLAALQIFGK